MNNFDLDKYIKDQTKPLEEDKEVDLGDWSVCDHVCGGGSQHKWHTMGCKFPVAGHKCHPRPPVKVSRACNSNPCGPNENQGPIEQLDDAWKYAQPTITLPPRLDARFVSHRFQQFEECKIKDEDLCIRRPDLGFKLGMAKAPILPGRGVLNRSTFSF